MNQDHAVAPLSTKRVDMVMMDNRSRIRHNAEILLVGAGGELILQQRDDKPGITNPGLVTTFGGGLEEGESALDAAFRELHEETSLKISRDRFVKYGDYQKTKEIHGEDWTVTFFVVKDVDYVGMKVFEGQGYVVVKDLEDLDHYDTSKLFREFAEDWFSGWRDFLFMPKPPLEVQDEVVMEVAQSLEAVPPSTTPIVFCPVGLVGAGKTSIVTALLDDTPRFVISSDRIRTMLYERGFNFSQVLDDILRRLSDMAIHRKANIFFDSNAGSKFDLIRHIEECGYNVMVFYVNPSEAYIEKKLQNMTWQNVPERFTFFKLPKHVMASYLSNKPRTTHENKRFMAAYPPDFVINPERINESVGKEVLAKISLIQEEAK